MDRLTKRLPDGNAGMDCYNCGLKKYKQCTLYGCRNRLMKRLAAYEDTEDAMINLAEQALGVEADRLRELTEADKAGRCVVLPCKVGDKLYRVFAGTIFKHEVHSMKYFAIQEKWDIDTVPFLPSVESNIGKTIFLTRAEAERAMEDTGNGNKTSL